MQQIKIFEGHGNNESDVNKWLTENPQVKILQITLTPMHDKFADGTICNQWISTMVVYIKDELQPYAIGPDGTRYYSA